MTTEQLLNKLKNIPRAYKIYVAILVAIEFVLFLLRPDTPGLYTQLPQLLPIVAALPFLFIKTARKPFARFMNTYGIIVFAFLALDYLTRSHAGLFQIVATFIPMALYWFALFVRWNIKLFKQKDARIALALATLSWGFIAFAFPPLPLGPAILILLVPWFIILNKFNRETAVFATFWASMVYNTINYYWIRNVMNVETAPSGLIFLGLILLIAYLSLFNVLASFVYSTAKNLKIKGKAYLLILFPIFYASIEMHRTTGDFAFPWNHLGYTFGNHLELLQALSIIGIFGYTILIVASNQIVAYAFMQKSKKRFALFAVPFIIFFALLIHGSCVLSAPEAAPFYNADSQENPSIAMVQPSIAQGAKWSKPRFDSIVTKTFNMAMDSTTSDVDMILLAETAVPDHIRRQPLVIRRLHQMADMRNASILTGALDYKRVSDDINNPRRFDIYNASFLFTPGDNQFPQRYIKKHLVPFSERIPFDDVFPILNYVDLGEGDFVPGKETPVYGPYNWTPYICYDAIFGDLIREAISAGSRLMVNITNDGWFGRSTAPFQHLNIVRHQAITYGYPVARLANSGVSAFIDQYGHYDQNTNIFETRVIQRKMPLKTRSTFYTSVGETFEKALLWFFAIYLVALFALSRIQKKN
ncbi:apolipoprotein N-acyltransferase [Fibrobacter sp. UWB12]|uniref:apolipoprotein N-acyltransferase n=1 Tax=Fibrobacter sp. UWB12 TaxID=1896203 RepID=UPI000914CC22|nr:apolipoprotein N-acyltransferase [Fibrobacter sp. UWB12]SHK39307.1 Apolipoprotein N-acyltransferase [Fibrobacter sp. UWB12]